MATKPKTWKDLRDQRRKASFIGRTDHLRVFSDNFAGEEPNYLAFVVTGEGGVGKSTLLEQYANLARGQAINARVVLCDDQQRAPTEAMAQIARELAQQGVSLREFDERLKKYRELRQELESDPQAPRGAIDLLARGVTDLTIKTLRGTPGVSVFADQLDPKAAGESLSQMIHYGISKWGNRDEVQLLREPEQVLTPLFVKLLNEACEKQRLVLMFDVFERTGDTLGPWLRALFNFDYGEFSTRLCVVIGGRDPLDQYWTEFAGLLCQLTLEPFTPDETRLYLANQDITDEQLVERIHADTGGLPVLVELLAATKPQPGAPLRDISKDAVQRFLHWTSEEQRRRVALLAAVPRQFNRDILTAALGAEAAADFAWLEAQSYIRSTTERGRFYHEKVRELMLRYLSQIEPTKLAATHKRLAEYFADQQRRLGLENEAAYNSAEWRRLECERVYHAVSVQPEQQIGMIINAFFHAFRWKRIFSRSIAGVCQQVARESKGEQIRFISERIDFICDLFVYPVEVKEFNNYEYVDINDFISVAGLTNLTKSEVYFLKSVSLIMRHDYTEAVNVLDKAIILDPSYHLNYAFRGYMRAITQDIQGSIDDFDKAIYIDGKEGSVYLIRGDANRFMQRHKEAISDFNRAIDLGFDHSIVYFVRGDSYRILRMYEEAVFDFNRAITLGFDNHLVYSFRGESYRLLRKYNEAVSDFDASIEYGGNNSWNYGSRGQVFYELGEFEKALSDFNKALSFGQNIDWVYKNRRNIYWLTGFYTYAIKDCDKLLAMNN